MKRVYRKFEVDTWRDDVFLALSAPPPNGQTLWVHLITSPRTSALPGVIVAREAVLADDLRWQADGFRLAFAEVMAMGLAKADWRVGLVVLTRALFHRNGERRETANPTAVNTIKAWATAFDSAPDCPLKYEYLSQLNSFADGLTDGMRDVYVHAFALANVKASVFRNQDQKQDTEAGSPPIPPSGGFASGTQIRKPVRTRKPNELTEAELASCRVVLAKLGERNGVDYRGSDAHCDLIAKQLRKGRSELDLRKVIAYCAEPKRAGGLGWEESEEFRAWLRPETLFGPKTIERYLDAARTWADKRYAPTPRESTQPSALVREIAGGRS